MGPAVHDANHEALVEGPPIVLTPHNVRKRTERGATLRDDVLAATADLRANGRRDSGASRIVAEVLSGGADAEKQSAYKALRRMSGREAGAAVDLEDLEDLGEGRLRVLGAGS